MDQSILTSVKKILGLADDYTAYDVDIIMHINSVFSVLNQLGIGPDNGFSIEDKSTDWSAFLTSDDPRFNMAKTLMYIRVRLLFDPPTIGYFVDSMQRQANELEWRLNVVREYLKYTPPTQGGDPSDPSYVWDLTGGLDFPPEALVGQLGVDTATGDVWRKS